MKKKYFLRGLGAGIVLSAVVCSAAVVQNKMSDDEVRARAKLLGMVEKTAAPMVDTVKKETSDPQSTEKVKETKEPEATVAPSKKTDVTNSPFTGGKNSGASNDTQNTTKQPVFTQKSQVTDKPAVEKKATTPKYISVNIEAGMWSKEICHKLQELGLVDDAEKFDDYLCDEGYASLIHIGKYQIPVGASYEEIAKIITK